MKFVADENIDKPIVEKLRELGHEIVYVAEISPSISDNEVLDIIKQEESILITSDKDFGELVFRQKVITHGIILIRMPGFSMEEKIDTILSAIETHKEELLHNFTVITYNSIRIRKIFF